jgi:hypothetical protein
MTTWKPKIRWYDYALAVLAADFIVGFMLWGINATTWWEPMLAGLLAGMIWQAWSKDYCQFRALQEFNKWLEENR